MSRFAEPNLLPIWLITRKDFLAYEDLRRRGIVNMMLPEVRALCGFDKDTHYSIMHHYAALQHREGMKP